MTWIYFQIIPIFLKVIRGICLPMVTTIVTEKCYTNSRGKMTILRGKMRSYHDWDLPPNYRSYHKIYYYKSYLIASSSSVRSLPTMNSTNCSLVHLNTLVPPFFCLYSKPIFSPNFLRSKLGSRLENSSSIEASM